MSKWVVIVLFLIAKGLTFGNCFFWDSIAGYSKPATYLLAHGFQSFVYPPDMVAEPPLAHLYLATLWQLLGRELWVAHLSITLFAVGVILQVHQLARRISPRRAGWITLLVLLEPATLTQLLSLSPDVLLCFFALGCLNAILDRRPTLLLLFASCLVLVSVRGIVVCAGIGLAYWIGWYLQDRRLKTSFARAIVPFIPALLLIAAWLIYRKIECGYFGYAPGFAYAEHRQLVGIGPFFRNITGLGRSMLDSGRIIVWIFLGIALWRNGLTASLRKAGSALFPIALLTILLTLACVTLPFSNPFGNRYFLVPYILLILTTVLLLEHPAEPKRRVSLSFVVMGLVLISGHFWPYPERLSKPWDCTLAHLPYYPLRQEMIHYLEQENIQPEEVATDFPLRGRFGDLDATNDERHFASVDGEKRRYLIYSNIYNWSDERIDNLNSGEWTPIKSLSLGQVWLTLYRSND